MKIDYLDHCPYIESHILVAFIFIGIMNCIHNVTD